MTEEEKIFAGQLFWPGAPELVDRKRKTHDLNVKYNQTMEEDVEERTALLGEMLGSFGEGCRIQGPVYFHYGVHTHIGRNFFANFNLTVQDDGPVTIGDNVSLGPGCTICTPVHPMIAKERAGIRNEKGEVHPMCWAKPVVIGDNCWFGANVTVCPGVTIGPGCVIGAGAVVTRDIPANSFAAGVPCRVIRQITEADSMKYKPEILADNTLL